MIDGKITLKRAERRELDRWARGQSRDAAQARRARLILLLADGERYGLIREKLDCDTNFIARWKIRFVRERLAGLYSRHAGRAPDRGSERQEARFFTWTSRRKPGSFNTDNPVPLSLELSSVQREILHLIIQDQASIQGPVEPERVILLWSEGISESTTAERLGISEAEVRTLRKRWWASTARIAAAEKKSHKAFNDLVSLIFRIPNEESPSETASNSSAASIQADQASQEKPTEQKELRAATRAVIEILHHKPKVYGINRSNWTLRSLADAFEKHYDLRVSHTTVGRLLKEAGLS